MTSLDIGGAVSFLFAPGHRPDRFDKAYATKADVIVVDLEDAVAPAEKEMARAAVAAWLDPVRPVMLRINDVNSLWFEADLELCQHEAVAAIMLPKAETGSATARIAALRPVLALIETATGVQGMAAIAAVPGVRRLGIGAIDLARDLDITGAETLLDPVFLQLVIDSRAARLPAPVAGVTTSFRDIARVEADAASARARGFGGKLCIHPYQIAAVHNGFRPSETELAWARRVVSADALSQGAATMLAGEMIDKPIVDRAKNLLARASVV